MALMNPLVLHNALLDFGSTIEFGNEDVKIEWEFSVLSAEISPTRPYFHFLLGEYGFGSVEFLSRTLSGSAEFRFARIPDPGIGVGLYFLEYPLPKTRFVGIIDWSNHILLNEKEGDDLTQIEQIPLHLTPKMGYRDQSTYSRNYKAIVYELKIYKGILDVDMELVFDLQWDGYGMPWNAVNGERAELISGEIKPLHKVLRKDKSFCHIYRLDEGAKLTFPNAPAGTLEITKTENNIVTTTQTSFSGGTLELTDREILDAKIVDEGGNTLFQLGKKVDDSVFDVVEPTRIGTVEGNVSNVKDVAWAMVFDGVDDYVSIPSAPQFSCISKDGLYTLVVRLMGLDQLKFNPNIFSYTPNCADNRNGLEYRGKILRFGYYSESGWYGVSTTAERFKWHLVCGINKNGELYIYADGIRGTGTGAPYTACPVNRILLGYGNFPDRTEFHGLISEAIIFSRALTDAEISLLTQSRYDEVSKEGLVLWVTVDPKTGDIIDRSPYRHTVTPHGDVETKLVALA